MTRLPYEQKEAIVLYLHGRMKFKAIAKLQNVSTKTAHTRYRAGLDKLRSILNSELKDEIRERIEKRLKRSVIKPVPRYTTRPSTAFYRLLTNIL
jgi:DNA-directed RNA polymerase specialized sigma24 family protein